MEYIIVISLLLLSGLFSGLTLSLLSLDRHELKRKVALKNKEAEKVYAVRKRGNLLLCTLLIGNVGVNAAIAILLGNITSGVLAGIIATGLIVIFGEIIPQATFARYALKIGAKTAWLVKIFIFILYPICGPIAWVLDKILGEEMPSVYSKHELIHIIKEHGGSEHSDVDADEERIIEGALSFSDKTVKQVMTQKAFVYALDLKKELDEKLLNEIKKEGFTRIPVYKNTINNVIGTLYTKDLINIEVGTKIENVYRKEKFLVVTEDEKLDRVLEIFIKHKIHLAFVENDNRKLRGVISLEDIIEEIINLEIFDETD